MKGLTQSVRGAIEERQKLCGIFYAVNKKFSGAFSGISTPEFLSQKLGPLTSIKENHWATLYRSRDSVACMVIHDGKLYAGARNGINVWNLDTNEYITRLGNARVDFMIVHADNNELITSGGNSFRRWDLDNRHLMSITKVVNGSGSITAMVHHHNRLYCALSNHVIKVISINTDLIESTITGFETDILSISVNDDKLFVGMWGGIQCRDITEDHNLLFRLRGTSGSVRSMLWKNHNSLFTSTYNKSVKVWTGLQLTSTLNDEGGDDDDNDGQGGHGHMTALSLTPSGHICAGSYETIHVWDGATGTHVKTLRGGHQGPVKCTVPYGNKLYSGGVDGRICVWNLKNI